MIRRLPLILLSLLINQGGGSLTASAMLPVDGAPTSADAWDMDADGDVDLAVVVTDSLLGEPVIRLLRNDSTPGQIAFTLFNPIGQGENPKLVNGADVSGDSQDDLIAVNASASPFADRLVGGSSPSMTIRPALVGIPGDITGDGHVNVNDLLAVINHWGTCPVPPAACTGDISPPPMGNGVVNVNDLLLVINNWG